MSDNIEDLYPLSPLQGGMLFHAIAEPGRGLYFNQLVCELRGHLDVEVFTQAWNTVVAAHPVLRTAFVWDDVDEPMQVVLREVDLPVRIEDWRDLSPEARESRLDALLAQDRREGFDLSWAPLVRLALLRIGDDAHRFVFSHSHLILDGWSVPLVIRDVLALYEGACAGKQPRIAAPRPYRDYIGWLGEQDLAVSEAFWRQALEGFDAPTNPRVEPGGGEGKGKGSRELFLSEALTSELSRFARRQGLTLHTLVQGAWALVLGHLCGAEDVVFGTTVSGRPPGLAGVEDMVGLFINTQPVRVRLPPDASFGPWLRQIQEMQVEARQHEHAPLVKVQRWSGVPAGTSLFETLVVFENYPLDAELTSSARALAVGDIRAVEADHFPLTLISTNGSRLPLCLRYDRARFTAAFADAQLERIRLVLEAMAARPDGALGTLSLLSEPERHQVLVAWNGTRTGFAAWASVQERFLAQVARNADTPAVQCEEEVVTYGALEARANQLAHQLRGQGVGADVPVALCLERGVEWVVGMLGILKAGGAYVPLDPSQPESRLRMLVEEVGAPVVVTQARYAAIFEGTRARRVVVEGEAALLDRWPSAAPPLVAVHPEQLAYVLFTSGSTGRPKGVAVTHGQLANYVQAAIERLGLADCASFALVSTLAADLGNTVLFPALCTGGLLHVLTQERASSPTGVAEYFERHGVDCVKLVPSHLAALMSGAEPRQVLPRKRLVLGGEAASWSLLEQVHALAPGCEVYNHYGPTEATVGVLAGRVELPRRPTSPAAVPLGRPMGNTRVYVLDGSLRPVPVGVAGELYAGGAQVTRGYLGHPELTAERYVPDPYGGEPGARMYRTGDKVRWLADGRLEFIGRVDFQVKVRGFRVEPGEVAAVLRAHPEVRDAAVVAREDVPGNKRLVAYATPASQPAPDTAALRAFLQQRLPGHMVPSALVLLDALPLTPNGKVDWRALPPPALPEEAARVFEGPRNAKEETLTAIWAQVLDRPRVDIHENFFELGGDSIIAIQVVSRAEQAGLHLRMKQLFDHPTVAGLAAVAGDAPPVDPQLTEEPPDGSASGFPLSGLSPEGLEAFSKRLAAHGYYLEDIEDLYPLSPLQHGILISHLQESETQPYFNQISFEVEGPLDERAFVEAWRQAADQYAILRTAFFWEGLDTPLQAVMREVLPPVDVEDLRHLSEADQKARLAAFFEEDRRRGLVLTRAPGFRLTMLRTGARVWRVVFSLTHLLLDGWSTQVVLREVLTRYEALRRGVTLARSAVRPYRDYIAWLGRQDLGAARDFWRAALAGFTEPTRLELGGAPRDVTLLGEVLLRMSAEETAALEAFSRQQGVTGGTLLQAAWALLLWRYTGEDDVLFGLTVSGRPPELAGIEAMVGLFINAIPVRVRLPASSPVGPWLKELQAWLQEARQYETSPLVEVRRWSEVPPGSALFESLVVFENYPRDAGLTTMSDELVVRDPYIVEVDSHPVTMMAVPGREWQLRLTYDARRFDASAAKRMVEQARQLLRDLCGSERRTLSELSLMSAEERRRLVEEWSGRREEYPSDASLAELFEAQVEKTPGAVAVEWAGQQVSYGELNRRANQLAHHLRGMGVGPEVRVGLCVERSLEWVVSALGILKAGGVYVPLDASYPLERLGWMKREAGVALLVAQERLADEVAAGGELVVSVDTEWDTQIAHQPETNPVPGVGGGNLAYVMFTSGSTGKPKGVAVPQRAVTRLVVGSGVADFGPEEVWLQLAPTGFDASTLEVWGALLHGGKLVVYPEGPLELEALGRRLKEAGVTSLWLTAALFEQMQAYQPEALSGVRQVLAGGDVLAVGRVRERVRGGGVLINGYGPTEGTTFTTVHRVAEEDVGVTVPIGKPVGNTRVYVLDEGMRPVPVGVRGELYVGGEGLAEGYVGRPEWTAERFVPSPFGDGERVYRTGDEVRWQESGLLEFLGRRDAQVKVRGYRIELGEVEEALKQHAQVKEAAAVVRGEGQEKRVEAYVVAPGGEGGALKEYVRQKLPEYMVPSVVVVLEALPLTPNGKVDRKALLASEAGPSEPRQHIEPRTVTEQRLSIIWCEVLGIERVSADADFFELGGHSLLATQLIAHIRSAFGVELPLRTLFASPALEGLALRIEESAREAAAPSVPALTRVPRMGALPVSFAQQRLWFIDQLHPGSASYNVPIVLRIEGSLDVDALQRAFSALVARHESLRTTFASHEGQPVQVVHPAMDVQLAFEDLSALPEAEREAEFRARATRTALRPFHLERGPLVRVGLSRLSPDVHTLVLVLHHIVSDGWSLGVLVREVGALYAAFLEGRSPGLPELPVQYADYAVWQRQWLSGAVLETQLDWWRQQLSGAPPHLELPTDKPRPATLSHRGAWVPVRLPRPMSDAVTALAHAEGATPFMVLLAAFQLLLSRYSGQEDVLVGSPIAGRRYEETEGLIGFFVNTLVLRAQVQPHATFRELLAQVRERTLGAYDHQDLPFEKLVEDLQPERNLGRSALFQVLFVLQNAPVGPLTLPALTVKPMGLIDKEAARFELSLSMGETPRGFEGLLQFSTDLFTEATAERMVFHLEQVLKAVTTRPESRLSEIPLLTDAERHQVLVEWNGSVQALRWEAVHRCVEHHAERTPEAPAVRCEERELTYRQLEAQANQVAHQLRGMGVGAEVPVALCLERGVEWVVAMLGILKAGGAYVPLDPSQPVSRLRALVEEVAAPVVVTQARHAATFEGLSARRVEMDGDAARLEAQPTEAPRVEVHPEQLAYVLFTSGSTGRPKGVAVTHGQLANYVEAANARLRLAECTRFALVSTLAADLGNTVLYAALWTGGLLHVLTQERASSAAGVAEYFQRHGVECLKVVPSHLAALMSGVAPVQVLPTKRLVVGGEAASWSLLEQVAALAPGCEVHNHYGPTETTVGVLAGRVELPRRAESPAAVPLGRPMGNTRVYVLDGSLRPVPVGVGGELYVGGAQVTRGYVGRPELTAERYVPDPYSGEAGARMYRTGDKVRWLGDGRLEFIGRTDFQVKVRGFRVESGEVAAVLRAHPDVQDAVVIAREEVPGEKRLVGYAVRTARAAPDIAALKAFLQQRLPGHMVPSALVVLETLPLTPNGKVDWRALPVPDVSARGSAPAYEAPASPMEETLAAVWAHVLRMERVGRQDDFFASGGHSLLATQVVARVRAVLGVEVPLRALFEAPTLRSFAQQVEQATRSQTLPALRPMPRGDRVPLSFAQQRLWFLDRLKPGGTEYNVPYVLRVDGPLDVSVLERAFSELVRRHEVLRTAFPDEGGAPVQRIASPSPFHLSVVELGAQDESEVRHRVRAEVDRSFELARGPLLRPLLLKQSEQAHVLVLLLHHIVSDGWSASVLLRELAAIYDAFSQGLPSPLPELPVQYADYALWQREWLKDEVLESQVRYWREALAGAPRFLDLPTDRPRPAAQTFRGGVQRQMWPKALWQQVESTARREGATPFMVLLAAYQTVLWRLSGQDDISVGFPIAGRTQAETEGLIGNFANTLVLRARVRPELSFRDMLAQVREVTLGAYAHQDVPFEKLVEALQPERDLSRSPLFQVSLTLQNTPAPEVKLRQGLSLTVMDARIQTSKFDLSMFVVELPEGAAASVNYNSDLFEAKTAERLLKQVSVLLEAAVANPETRLGELPLMPATERLRLVEEWSGRREEYPSDASLAELFEAQVEKTPGAVAVEWAGQQVSYGELNRRANQLAHHLRGMGVGPEVRVGLCVERSLEWVVSALGILKAGGVYVPLDASYPLERLGWMKREAGVALLVAQERLADEVAAGGELVVSVDTEWDTQIAHQPETNPVPGVGGGNLAYVMFTSGSTGKPKGVAVPQRAVTRLVVGSGVADFGPEEVWLQLAPTGFDASTLEVWGALLHGGKLVVYPEGPLELEALGRRLKEAGVTSLWLTAALFEQMQAYQPEALSGVRQVLAGGDVLAVGRVRERVRGGGVLINGYGPTEGTTFTTVHRVAEEDVGVTVPIGKPVGNTRVYVLDEGMRPVPVGVRGSCTWEGRGWRRGTWGGRSGRRSASCRRHLGTESGCTGRGTR
ncbi:non-ribosomal peptide synthetase [Myxococcus xanthus]|uniref:Non-ribosomal peptide synthetase n=1 Tax=Myxococcus xanthus TaxID=34 RepID=A0AAE6G1K1_MYXXA|nr:non-ribosomal peptide synthetase [Myxococcus xanthus]QDE69016.1 non-ribosomal peptide synthetase [Myxococcus xanthus]